MGYLDSIANQIAGGWACSPDGSDKPAILDVFIDDEMVGETVADLFREDLHQCNTRDGYAAFEFTIPLSFFDGKEHSIRIVIRDSGETLQKCPLTFRGNASEMPFIRERFDWIDRTIVLQPSRRANRLAERIRERKKVAVLATFHLASKFLGYHYALAKMLTDAGFVVVLVHSTAAMSPRLSDIDRGDCFLYCKRNLGYDFGSWAVGIHAIADVLHEVQELVLLNDSIIALMPDISGILTQMRKRGADLVGLTDSYEKAYHLQSYFLQFGPRICQSSLLQVFMAKYPFSPDKDIAIKEGEIGISRFFLEQGFTAKALYPYERIAGTWLRKAPQLARAIEDLPVFDISRANSDATKSYRSHLLEKLESIACSVVNGTPLNPIHFFWDVLATEFGHPFLKREFLLLNPGEVPTYFQLAELLDALPAELQLNILEIRQIYGGYRVPFIGARHDSQSASAAHLPRSGTARGGVLVA